MSLTWKNILKHAGKIFLPTPDIRLSQARYKFAL